VYSACNNRVKSQIYLSGILLFITDFPAELTVILERN
jgi:hypothetical protein